MSFASPLAALFDRPWHAVCSGVGAAVLALSLSAAGTVSASPLDFVPFDGQGNLSVFDAAAGSGGWVGSLLQTPPPQVPDPLALVSVVLFQLDPLTHTVSGQFSFATTDLLSTLFGDLGGSYIADDLLTAGGQLTLDYTVRGGTGALAGATGFGLALLDLDLRASGPDNYHEAGLLSVSLPVPEPGTGWLVLAALPALGLRRRRRVAALR